MEVSCFFSGTPNSSNSWTICCILKAMVTWGTWGSPVNSTHFFWNPRFTSSQWPIPKPSTQDENGLPQQRGRMAISSAGLRPHDLRGRRRHSWGFTVHRNVPKNDALGGERNWKNHRNLEVSQNLQDRNGYYLETSKNWKSIDRNLEVSQFW